jgi:hypothetical protein
MALVTADRVRDTSTTTGTSAFTVSGTAPTGYRTFSAVCATNDTFLYFIAHQSANEWEVGVGTYSASNTITRTTVLSSSNAGSATSFSAGSKDVVLTQTAERIAIPRIDAATNLQLFTSATEAMRIDSQQGLIYGGAAATLGSRVEFHMLLAGGGLSNLDVYGWNTNSRLRLGRSNNATIGSHTAVSNTQTLGQIVFLGDDGTNFTTTGASIQVNADSGTISSGIIASRMAFSTANSSGTNTEAMRIDSAQQMRFMQNAVPGGAGAAAAQIRGDDQPGVSLAASSNTSIAGGNGNLIFIVDSNSAAYGLYVASGGSVVLISAAFGIPTQFVAPTTTPGANTCSVAWDGSSNYRLYVGSTIATHTYKWFTIKTG